jgi:hypothetical protein
MKNWTIDILGKRWSVQWKRPGKLFGRCDSRACLIRVDPDCAADQRRDTLLHEVVHAIDNELDTRMKERQVRLLATGLLHFLRANPEAVRWMLADTGGSRPSRT